MFMIRILMAVMIGILAGCASSQTEPLASVEITQEATAEATESVAIATEETAITRGELLFKTTRQETGFACATCHYATSEGRLIGPGLVNLAERFAEYGLEIDLNTYIHEAIVAPNAFIAPADPIYPSSVMPQNYQEVFTEAEINDLIAYILSL